METVVSLADVSMAFGTNRVLSGVSMSVSEGSVVALIGANGAGKSTLIKILSGVYPEHGGEVLVDGRPVRMDSPRIARSLGIHTVHQRIADGVVPGLSVAENLVFDELSQPDFGAWFSLRKVLPRAREVAALLDLRWTDEVLRNDVYGLGVADQQLLLLARALDQKPRMLVLDEPTSALSMAEVERLFAVIRRLKASNVAILYVSHHLSEIDTLADSLVVLRDGRIRLEQARPFGWTEVIRAMLGDQVLAAEALLPGWSIGRSVALPFLSSLAPRGIVPHGAEARRGRWVIDQLGVVATGEGDNVDELSGGNQQRVVVGRWLAGRPSVLVLDEPFRGVDIGARAAIGRRLRVLAEEGAAVIITSSDVDEILQSSDRVIVLGDGLVRTDVYITETNRDQIIERMSEIA
jgi:ABC-type sugar transport system ATPase subunit